MKMKNPLILIAALAVVITGLSEIAKQCRWGAARH